MRHYLISITTVLISIFAVSCTDDDSPERINEQKAINFCALVPNAPRAASTTTATIKDFIVYAYTGGMPYMQNVLVTRNGSTWSYSPIVYWPSTPLNFYAYSPNITNSTSPDDPEIGSIPGYKNTGHTDLLYAVNMGEVMKPTPVNLNFRHAMSRVSVMLSSSNPQIDVRVHYVKLHNIYLQGTFHFPHVTTSPQQPDHIGNWSDLKLNNDFILFTIIGNEDILTLTPKPVDITENNLDVSFFIPQPLTQLVYDGSDFTGNGIEIDCEIFDTTTGTKIWPSTKTPPAQLIPECPAGRLLFPASTDAITEWKIGHSYIYNIKIDNPDVLKPIMFSVSVDEYQTD